MGKKGKKKKKAPRRQITTFSSKKIVELRGLGAPIAFHRERKDAMTSFAKQNIRLAVNAAHRGGCHAALASAAEAIRFASEAQAHFDSYHGGRQKPLPIYNRAFRVHKAVAKRCLLR